ncbi:MAG: pilus assembly protein PilO [Gammaproteobacteria bacterium]|nr:MAG: pilus assembly protein PilO [Gammaproteobacteria bacterium]
MFGQDLNLNWDELDIWPQKLKVGIIVVLCAALLAVGGWFDTQVQWERLKASQAEEASLKETFSVKQMKAARLPQYKAHLAEIRKNYGQIVRRLPGKAEVASLLAEISQTGISNNLEFKLFKPEAERPFDFYSEIPIKIRVTGKYHDFGRFVAGLAALPRIVTLSNIYITERKKGTLQMDAIVKTYRYREESL